METECRRTKGRDVKVRNENERTMDGFVNYLILHQYLSTVV